MEGVTDNPNGPSRNEDDTSYDVAEGLAEGGADRALRRGIEGHEQFSRSSVADSEDVTATEEPSSAAASEVAGKDSELEFGHGSIQDPLDDAEPRANGQDSKQNGLGDSITIPSPPQTLRAIKVVLRPPPDPDAYHRIPPSRTVLRVLEDSESGGEIFYTVEFRDGRIEHVSANSNRTARFRCYRRVRRPALLPQIPTTALATGASSTALHNRPPRPSIYVHPIPALNILYYPPGSKLAFSGWIVYSHLLP
ncbi:hypothetical protein F4823DRAFT_267855 [Ustulina deusta]|nr:hypothetical protein F4823DRAFT_267855 [Ustulina deusta]